MIISPHLWVLCLLAACRVPTASFEPAVDASADATPPAPAVFYANTATSLYRVDPDSHAVALVGAFTGLGSDMITDIAVDRTDAMIGTSFTSVYRIDPATAACTPLAPLSGTFNGLAFVPAAMLAETGADVLVATRNSDGLVFRLDPATGIQTQIGDMGAAFMSSGDLVADEGFGIVQTVSGVHDRLARLTPGSFAATVIGNDTGFDQIWGIAYWKNQVFGFTAGGDFLLIDPATGVASVLASDGTPWWGAASSPTAPVQ